MGNQILCVQVPVECLEVLLDNQVLEVGLVMMANRLHLDCLVVLACLEDHLDMMVVSGSCSTELKRTSVSQSVPHELPHFQNHCPKRQPYSMA